MRSLLTLFILMFALSASTQIIRYYDSPQEADSLVQAISNDTTRLVHKDFINEQGFSTDGKSGRLTFIVAQLKTFEELQEKLIRVIDFNITITYSRVDSLDTDKLNQILIEAIAKLSSGKTKDNDVFLNKVFNAATSTNNKINQLETLRAQTLSATTKPQLAAIRDSLEALLN